MARDNTTWLGTDGDADLGETCRDVSLDDVPRLVEQDRAPLTLIEELGRGAMGIVFAARQTRLEREVAVKTVHGGRPSALRGLLREAWIVAQLEHPQIVPVHDLVWDEAGRPQLVMKRIHGVPWSALIAEPDRLPDDARADVEGFHIRVAEQVCRALEFAHSRGFLHRDVKPANVMVGAFGEVTLLDWGVAVSVRADASGRRPDLEQQTRLVGTPLYMPAEMFRADFSRVGPASDLYLLAASLFHALTGRAPRRIDSLEALRQQAGTTPALDHLPVHVQALLRRALDPDPDARGELAQFRMALGNHLSSRDAVRMARRVAGSLDQLDVAVAEGAALSEVYRLSGECLFGVRELADRWPGRPEPSLLGRRLVGSIVPFELARGDISAARLVLSQVPDPPAFLLEQVERADRARAEREAEDEAARRVHDARTGREQRLLISVAMGAVWLGQPLIFGALGMERGYPRMALQEGVRVALYLSVFLLFRPSLLASSFNRTLMYTGLFVPSMMAFPLGYAMWLHGATPEVLTTARAVLDGAAVATVAAVGDPRLWPAAIAYQVGIVGSAMYPAFTTPILMASTAVLIGSLVLLYVPRAPTRLGHIS